MENNEILLKILENQESFSKELKDMRNDYDKRFDKNDKCIDSIENTITRIEYQNNDNFRILVDGFNMLNEKLDIYHQEHEEKLNKHDDKIINHDIRIQMLEKRKRA